MINKGFIRNIKALKIIDDEQIEKIYQDTLEVLESVGVRFESERALKLFADNGCKVDFKNRRVRIPSHIVEDCLRKCPSSIHLKARDPKNNLRIGGNIVYFGTFPGMRKVDLDAWEQKIPTLKDNDDAVKVLDALDYLHVSTSYTPYCEIKDVPPVMLLPVSCASRMKYFTKISRIGQGMESYIWEIKMAKVVGVDVFGAMESSPPLTWHEDAINCAFACIEAGFPIEVGCACVMGGTGPVTVAGSMITSNAEIMSGIVLVQLVKPGTGVIVNHFVFPQDMRGGFPVFGSIESSLHRVVFNQFWRKYNFPIMNGSCAPSSSMTIDFQCGYEKGIGALLSALSGANIVQLHGGIYGELTYHPVQSVLDDDIAGMIGRFTEGVEVNIETLALDLIEKVGPIPGFYLDKEHTRKWWKKEQFIPKVAVRLSYPEWIRKGKKNAIDYAKEKVKEILSTYEPIPLPEEQSREIDKILEEAKRYYAEKGML